MKKIDPIFLGPPTPPRILKRSLNQPLAAIFLVYIFTFSCLFTGLYSHIVLWAQIVGAERVYEGSIQFGGGQAFQPDVVWVNQISAVSSGIQRF